MQTIGLVGVERDRLLEGILGGEHLPLHHIGIAKRDESLGILWIERRRAARQRITARNRALDDLALLLGHAGTQRWRKQRRQRIGISEQRGGRCKIGLTLHHLVEDRNRACERRSPARSRRDLGTQEIEISRDIARATADEPL